MAAHHPPLLTAEDATAYRTHRIDRVERLNGALIEQNRTAFPTLGA